MRVVKVFNQTQGELVCDRVEVANTSMRRLFGLLGRQGLDAGKVCGSNHPPAFIPLVWPFRSMSSGLTARAWSSSYGATLSHSASPL